LIEGPDDLLSFSPEKPKIKGVNYELAKAAAEEILGMKFGGKRVGKLVRFLYVRTKNNLRLRQFMVKCWSWYVSSAFYRLTQKTTKISSHDTVE
jgi:hypothetical protein